MGDNLQWVAVKCKSQELVLKTVGLKATGIYQELAEDSDISATKIDEWYLISIKFSYFTDEIIKKLSKNFQVVRCDIIESTMCSNIELWENEKQIWSVLHYGDDGTDHLSIEGNPPSLLYTITNKMRRAQAEDVDGNVDYIFEIPVELGYQLVGYRHDEDIIDDSMSEPWEELKIAESKQLVKEKVEAVSSNHGSKFFRYILITWILAHALYYYFGK